MTSEQLEQVLAIKDHCVFCGQKVSHLAQHVNFYHKKKESKLYRQGRQVVVACPTCYSWRINMTNSELKVFVKELLSSTSLVFRRTLGPCFAFGDLNELIFFYEKKLKTIEK